jgi:UDP-N-acetylmuramate: L-alanyl-gamma-D-glutamyl-meso-diaminopimelate ligase
MNIHFIAIGGAAMHNLALALHKKGETITGSDDEIFDPARTRLAEQGLLPDTEGWHPDRITKELDAVVLGMHAREDNPELLRAKDWCAHLSYPEFLLDKPSPTRVVVGGSHGKTTVTSMSCMSSAAEKTIRLHGGRPDRGFDTMVGLSEEARIAGFEGDEYLTSALDPRPNFTCTDPIAVVTGIAWDHINVFPP